MGGGGSWVWTVGAWCGVRYRGVSWYLFPLGLVLLLISTWSGREPGVFWLDMVLNTGFLAFQLALLTVYFAWKRVSFRQLWNEYMGIGDVLFFLMLAIVLPFPFFPVFMIASLLLSTLLGIIVFRRSTVPLAGLQALFLLVFLLHDGPQILFQYPLYVLLLVYSMQLLLVW